MTQKERLEDILKHSENHNHHTFDGLVACCAIDSAVDFQLLDAHPVLDYNEGQKSDVFLMVHIIVVFGIMEKLKPV